MPAKRRPKITATAKKAEARADASFTAEGGYTINIVDLLNPDRAIGAACPNDLPSVFKRNRELLDQNDFVGSWVRLRRIFFDDCLRAQNADALTPWLAGKGAEFWSMLAKLNADLWSEWLLQDNAVVFWLTPLKGRVPKPIVLDAEKCKYSNEFGHETLKLELPRKKLTPAQVEELSLNQRWVKAYEKGEITLDPVLGENFKVLTRAKMGKGFAMPRLRQAFKLLGTLDHLRTADFGGALTHRDIIRQVKAGHEIKNGELAGRPDHFITKEQKTQMERELKNKQGPFRAITNFDIDFLWKYLEAAYFDKDKYAGTMEGLDRWGGAGMLLLAGGAQSTNAEFLARAFAAEGRQDRDDVGGLLNALLADPTFATLAPPKGAALRVGWNPHTFRTGKEMLELVRFAMGQGAMSTRTGRESFGLDDTQEGDRIESERAKPDRVTPVFEPKQGLLSEKPNGRPPEE